MGGDQTCKAPAPYIHNTRFEVASGCDSLVSRVVDLNGFEEIVEPNTYLHTIRLRIIVALFLFHFERSQLSALRFLPMIIGSSTQTFYLEANGRNGSKTPAEHLRRPGLY